MDETVRFGENIVFEDLSYYLVEMLGEATAVAGLPAAILVLFTSVIARDPKKCITAGLIGALLLPALHFAMHQMSTASEHSRHRG